MNNRPVIGQPHVRPKVIQQQFDSQTVWHFDNHWSQSFCQCTPCSRCCFACFCFPCFMCKVSKNMGEHMCVGCCPLTSLAFRTKLRTARRIEGSFLGDCCAATFCSCFSALQLSHELETQGLWADLFGSKQRQHHHQRNTYDNNHKNQGGYD